MRKATIRVNHRDIPEGVTIPAWTFGPDVAIHHDLTTIDSRNPHEIRWAVTHIGTGSQIAPRLFDTRAPAERYARIVQSLFDEHEAFQPIKALPFGTKGKRANPAFGHALADAYRLAKGDGWRL
jgi:hypothetical protein